MLSAARRPARRVPMDPATRGQPPAGVGTATVGRSRRRGSPARSHEVGAGHTVGHRERPDRTRGPHHPERPRRFARGDVGIDQDAVPAAATILEFASVTESRGRTLELHQQTPAGWSTVHANTGETTRSSAVAGPRRHRLTRPSRPRAGIGSPSATGEPPANARSVPSNPWDYSGSATEAYPLIRDAGRLW